MKLSLWFLLILVIACLMIPGFCAAKGKGLFSGEILGEDIELFIGNISDSPTFIAEQQQMVKSNPQDDLAWVNIGKAQMDAENSREAQEAFTRAIAINGTNNEAWEGLYYSSLDGDDWTTFLDLSKGITIQYPDWTGGYFWYARGLQSSGQPYEAMEALDRSLEIDPGFADALWSKAIFYENTGLYTEAAEYYDRILNLDTADSSAWQSKADALFHLKRYGEALYSYDEALKTDNNGAIWNAKGDCFYYLKQYDEALVAYDQAIKLGESSHLVQKGWTLHELGRDAEALDAMNKALTSEDATDLDSMSMAVLLDMLGRTAEAEEMYKKASTSNSIDIKYNLQNLNFYSFKAFVLENLGRYDEALKVYDEGIKLDTRLWWYKADLYNELERYQDALAAYDASLSYYPDDAYVWLHKGGILEKQGKLDDALKAYESAVKADADNLFDADFFLKSLQKKISHAFSSGPRAAP